MGHVIVKTAPCYNYGHCSDELISFLFSNINGENNVNFKHVTDKYSALHFPFIILFHVLFFFNYFILCNLHRTISHVYLIRERMLGKRNPCYT